MDKLLIKALRSLTETCWRKQRQVEDEHYAFLHLSQDLQETAYLLAEGWTDWEITNFLDLELGDIQRSRQRLMQFYRPS